MSTVQVPKHRTSFTDIERQGLRFHHQKYPATSPPALASWFELQFGRKISVSSVHDILSDKYAFLDSAEATGATRKQRGPQWRDLEDSLFKWWQEEQPRRVTGNELKEMATELWQSIPACQGKKTPSFSDGWLTKWRDRHGVAQAKKPMSTALVTPIHSSLQVQLVGGIVRLGLPPQVLPAMPDSFANKHRTKRQCTDNTRGQPTLVDLDPVINPSVSELANEPASVPSSQASSSSDILSWKNVWELFTNCSVHAARDTLMPAENVFKVFDPILSAAETSFKPKYRNESALEFRRAVRLLNAAESLRLLRAVPEIDETIYDEWFLDYMRPEFLRSASPGVSEDYNRNCMTLLQQSSEMLHSSKPQASPARTVVFSTVSKGGRIDMWTRRVAVKLSPNDGSNVAEELNATIVITPPINTYLVPQTVLRLTREMRHYKSTLLTPIIAFRRTRPDSDEIFRIAKRGTSEALQKALSSGEASLTDCDTEGRSLTNYALQGRNPSTLKYLLTKIDDPNSYEADFMGELCPLIANLSTTVNSIGPASMRKLACLNLLLDYGADLSLSTSESFGSLFAMHLIYATVDVVTVILDKGGPFVSANTILSLYWDTYPLLEAVMSIRHDDMQITSANEKICLLVERGADVMMRDGHGRSCLHVALNSFWSSTEYGPRNRDVIKDALVCLVTAGADINACDMWGYTVSELACMTDFEELWIEVLAECGYYPEQILQYVNSYYQGENTGFGAFAIKLPKARTTRLSFAEYRKQRKSIPFRSHRMGNTGWQAHRKEQDDWKKFVRSVEEDSEGEVDDCYNGEVDIYSTELGAEWWS